MAEEYNGWTNRETWLVGVHDFFDYDTIKEALQNATENPERIGYEVIANKEALGGIERALTLHLADWMKDYHEDYIYEGTRDLDAYIRDLIADHKINWIEIAGHYDEEIKEALSTQKVGTLACNHDYLFDRGCGAQVCYDCGDHKDLARCYCGWAASGGNGSQELEDLGEQIEND